MKRTLLTAAALAALAAVPAAASAATVTMRAPCFLNGASGGLIGFSGAGFTPNGQWTAQADQVFASGAVDPSGNLAPTTPVRAPIISRSRISSKRFTLNVADNAGIVAATTFKVANVLAKWAGSGSPRKTVRWRFSGFASGAPIYVHVRRHGHTLKTTRAGKAGGACGVGSKRLRRLPVRSSQVHNGTYKIVVDNRRKFSFKSRPQYRVGYRVYTRSR